MEFGFFFWLMFMSVIAALAAQLRHVNGEQPNWRQIAASSFFYSTVGVAYGLLASTQSKEAAIIGAVSAALLLRLDPERLLRRFFPAGDDKIPKS